MLAADGASGSRLVGRTHRSGDEPQARRLESAGYMTAATDLASSVPWGADPSASDFESWSGQTVRREERSIDGDDLDPANRGALLFVTRVPWIGDHRSGSVSRLIQRRPGRGHRQGRFRRTLGAGETDAAGADLAGIPRDLDIAGIDPVANKRRRPHPDHASRQSVRRSWVVRGSPVRVGAVPRSRDSAS